MKNGKWQMANVIPESASRGESGQTLIALLIFVMLTMTITFAAAAVTIINTQANNNNTNGQLALMNAESGVENALLQLERNPNYTGETMTLANGTATITVSGSTAKTITSVGSAANLSRKVTATANYSSNSYTLTGWSETP